MKIKIRNVKSGDYKAIEAIMKQAQQLHIDCRTLRRMLRILPFFATKFPIK